MSVWSSWVLVIFKASVSLLIFCVLALSIFEKGGVEISDHFVDFLFLHLVLSVFTVFIFKLHY